MKSCVIATAAAVLPEVEPVFLLRHCYYKFVLLSKIKSVPLL